MEKSNKVYVTVDVRFKPDGRRIPLSIVWEDGKEYEIDQVLDVCRAASLKAGGAGIRYKVRIGQSEAFVFLEEDKWFVERKSKSL